MLKIHQTHNVMQLNGDTITYQLYPGDLQILQRLDRICRKYFEWLTTDMPTTPPKTEADMAELVVNYYRSGDYWLLWAMKNEYPNPVEESVRRFIYQLWGSDLEYVLRAVEEDFEPTNPYKCVARCIRTWTGNIAYQRSLHWEGWIDRFDVWMLQTFLWLFENMFKEPFCNIHLLDPEKSNLSPRERKHQDRDYLIWLEFIEPIAPDFEHYMRYGTGG